MGSSSFFDYWKKYCPYIIVGKPMTDLCWLCKQNNSLLQRSANLPEDARIAQLHKQLGHLHNVQAERKVYNEMVDKSKADAKAAQLLSLGPRAPNSYAGRMHYSFDFAQQVHLPASPLQPGHIYFLVPRKVGIFGVCAEALPRQVNYLIDEGMSSGKGSNMVISLLHYFFEYYGFGERAVDLHCDNCAGQNKNRFVLSYFLWRVMSGLLRKHIRPFVKESKRDALCP